MGGGWKRVIAVEECSHPVLSAIIDFMYGINIPDDFSIEDAYSVLAMADLYLMEGLKDAVAPLLGKQLKTDNILETSRMAEKHNALKLKEVCCEKREHTGAEMANKLLGVNLAELDHFKRRSDFSSHRGYSQYVKANIKPNMIVRCVQMSVWDDQDDSGSINAAGVPDGTLGRVVNTNGQTVTVKWQGMNKCVGAMCWLEILTPPCDIFA